MSYPACLYGPQPADLWLLCSRSEDAPGPFGECSAAFGGCSAAALCLLLLTYDYILTSSGQLSSPFLISLPLAFFHVPAFRPSAVSAGAG